MSSFRPRILVVDDEPDMVENLARILGGHGYDTIVETDSLKALEAVNREAPDLVLTDLRMPGVDGMGFLGRLRQRHGSLPVIMLTGYASVDSAVEAMRSGATDYMAKPFTAAELVQRVARAIESYGLKNGYVQPRAGVVSDVETEEIVGQSSAFMETLALADKLAPAGVPVLLLGEAGSGKEMLARRMHRLSRPDGRFCAVRCGDLVEGQLEAVLFGHESDPLEGPGADEQGLLESANRGTAFLAEISETTLAFQSKLLRLIEGGEYLPIRGSRPRRTAVRIIAASARSLHKAVADGCFREDLFDRLRGASIRVPSLRERQTDIPLLTRYWLERCARQVGKAVPRLDPGALDHLVQYGWPGNVGELRNVVERAVVMAGEGVPLRAEHLALGLAELPEGPGLAEGLREAERARILEALRACEGNRTQAAKRLGIGRRTLYDKLVRLGISLEPEL